jgi:DNA polymerase
LVETLAELREEVDECVKCPLGRTRTKLVFGVGSEKAELMFIGEAPGYYEDKQGEPFVGAAGKLLDELLGSIGLARKQVYIANVLKCRPPNNRDPQPEEVDTCKPYLIEQIKIIQPKIIATLGNHATRLILAKNVSISTVRGKKIKGSGYFVFPIFHPAAALYTPSMKISLEKDFQELKKILEEKEEPPAPEPEQMGLF